MGCIGLNAFQSFNGGSGSLSNLKRVPLRF